MQLVVTNLTGSPVWIQDLYCEVPANKSVTTTRSSAQLTAMTSLQKAVAAGSVSVSLTPSADELASGLLAAPQSIQAADMAPVAASDVPAADFVLRCPVAAGAGGSADDVTVYAVNTLPWKIRIEDAWAYISAGAAGGRTIGVRSAAAGGGTLAAEIDAAANGRRGQTATVTASQVFTPGALVGLFLRRSDSAIAGEVFIAVRRES